MDGRAEAGKRPPGADEDQVLLGERFKAMGLEHVALPPDAFRAFIADQTTKRIIREAKISVE